MTEEIFHDFLHTLIVNQNVKAYYLLMMGSLVIKELAKEKTDEKLVKCYDQLSDYINTSFSSNIMKQYASTTDILWNSVILAGTYTFWFSPDHVLCHDWLCLFPITKNFFSYTPDKLYPYILAISIVCHYHSYLCTYPT